MTHAFHQTKFRWTENLTSRFIQLRKENGNLFTGRKYSAQAGWEHILQQMRQEFPTIMADVHYRVLKKKWSNLLQQYKNPVHGDKNKSDDISWPFYGAIDEVLGAGYGNRNDEDDVNPHEFLCLSVTPDESALPQDEQRADSETEESNSITALRRLRSINEDFSIEIERLPRVPIRRPRTSATRASLIAQELRRRNASEVLVSRLPPATELSIKTVSRSSSSSVPVLRVNNFSKDRSTNPSSNIGRFLRSDDALAVTKINGNHSMKDGDEDDDDDEDDEEAVEEVDGLELEEEIEEVEEDEPPQKRRKRRKLEGTCHGHECSLEKCMSEFFEYTKRRDEENRVIMNRILNAVERIADK
ncbi:YTH domain-containing protein 1-like isoform X2 [Neodiprion virginianus]|uniref:YTH domain-containing protein 1-like isoform X2 n=1 Tax=Neodiprion virginianus TaxID=2961670 RepID=UPI001EE6FE42|nr:YTH domain-containing protein 1-like isoform X2 [Neodiprion virginianus]